MLKYVKFTLWLYLLLLIPDRAYAQYDYEIDVSNSGATITRGHSLYIRVYPQIITGTPASVDFSVSGLPSGVTASWPHLGGGSSGTGAMDEQHALKLTASESATIGTFTLTITGLSSMVTRMATWDVTVELVPDELPYTPITELVPVPSLSTWEANMLTWGQDNCDYLTQMFGSDFDHWLDATYYDGMRVFYQIAAYTSDMDWYDCAELAEDVYRDGYVEPSNGTVTGFWQFTTGLRMDYQLTADMASYNAIVDLRVNNGWATDSLWTAYSIGANVSREVAYASISHMEADAVGYTTSTRKEFYVDMILGHIDQWFVTKNYLCPADNYCDVGLSGLYYIQPFMVALSADALIKYYEEVSPDPRIPVAIKLCADWMWEHAWDVGDQAFWYQNYTADPDDVPSGYWDNGVGGSPDLNLLIAPMYAWLYKKTGDTNYRDQHDDIFAGGVCCAFLENGKQFNQNYKWSFKGLEWRNEIVLMPTVPHRRNRRF